MITRFLITFPRPLSWRGLLCVLCLGGTAAALHAQAPAARDQPITLSPFEVSTDQDVGYLAGNTLAGSRLNTRIKDTPASISVLTAEFLEDIGAFTLEEALAYAGNLEFDEDDSRDAINGNSNFSSPVPGIRIRGLDADRARNYFPTGGISIENAFVERVEDSRGPNSILFGIGSPGGLVNVSTKRALFGRAFQKASVTTGSHDMFRGTLDINQPLIAGKLAVRLNLVYNDTPTFRHWEFREHQRAHLAVGYRITDRTQLRVEVERGRERSNRAVTFNLIDEVTEWIAAGRPTFTSRSEGLGFDFIDQNPNRPVVTYFSNDNTIFNEGRKTPGGPNNSISAMRTDGTGNVITDRSLVDFSVNHGGPGQDRESYFTLLSAFLEHQLADNTFLEVAYNHRENKFDFRDPRGPKRQFFGDPNALRADGTPNPFAGQLFLETQWFRGHRFDQGDTGRAMISHDLDLEKWGDYRLGAYGEYDKSFIFNGNFEEMWVDAETGEPAFNSNPNNAQNDVRRRTYVTEGVWETYSVSGPVGDGGLLENLFDPITGRTLSSVWMRNGGPREVYTTQKTGMIVAQGRWFDDRLIAAGGLRRDEFDELTVGRSRNPSTQIWELERDPDLAQSGAGTNSAIGRTKTFGLVYHVTDWLSLYYNVADNVAIPSAGRTMLDPSGDPTLEPIPVPKPEGEGEDYGIGLDLLDGRLYLRATYFETRGKNQSITSPSAVRNANERIMDALILEGAEVEDPEDPDPDAIITPGLITQAEHDARTDVGGHGLFGHETTGYELEVTGNPTQNWRITFKYAYIDPVEDFRFTEWLLWEDINRDFLTALDAANPDIDVLGIETSQRSIAAELEEIRDELADQTAATNVGKLGARHHKYSVVTRYNFSSGPLKGFYIGGGYRHQSKMFVGTDDDDNKLYGNSFWEADLLAGYTIRNFLGIPVTKLQLNVFNVTGQRKPLLLRFDDDNVTTFRERIRAPTEWRLTASFEF